MSQQPDKVRLLHEIARDYGDVGLDTDLPGSTVDDALQRAGLDPADETERCRFRRLVREANKLCLGDKLAELGRFGAEARRRLGDAASMMAVIALAQELREQSDEVRDSCFG